MNLELEAAKAALIAKLVSLRVPQMSARADETELHALGDLMAEAGQAMDEFYLACGLEFVATAPGGHGFNKTIGLFSGRVTDALNEARYEIQDAAQVAASEYAEA